MYADAQITLNKFREDFKKFRNLYTMDFNMNPLAMIPAAFMSPYGLSNETDQGLKSAVMRTVIGKSQETEAVIEKNQALKDKLDDTRKGSVYYQNHYARIANPINLIEGVAGALAVTVASACDRLTKGPTNIGNMRSNLAGTILKAIFATPFQLVRYAAKVVNLPINLALDQLDRGVRALGDLRNKKENPKWQYPTQYVKLQEQEEQSLQQKTDKTADSTASYDSGSELQFQLDLDNDSRSEERFSRVMKDSSSRGSEAAWEKKKSVAHLSTPTEDYSFHKTKKQYQEVKAKAGSDDRPTPKPQSKNY